MLEKKLAEYPPEIQVQAGKILFKLSQIGFSSGFSRMEEGPILKTFYFQPGLESLFSKAMGKGEEIAGTLSVESVRLYRSGGLLAVEVPRPDRQLIRFDLCLHEMLSKENIRNEMALPLLLGKSPKGDYLFADLGVQPHMLIAGSTGSGKSIFISQFCCSTSVFKSPKELEFILVDTKNLDLVLFKGLPHIRQVITQVPDLRRELEDLLREVRFRTNLMSGVARNIKEYNAMQSSRPLSYKILLIDELADVLETDAALRASMEKDERADTPSIVSLLKRITQISRAAGIHVVAATQRPSVKMITGDPKVGFGDIKANFPARICFKLPSMQDSRVVLDENGAEDLLGKGDYLYKLAGLDSAQRAHSAFVSMEDIALILNQHEEIRRMYASV